MKQENKRNTAKEKAKENKKYPYKSLINQKKWRIVDSTGKSYGEYVQKVNARKEVERLKYIHVRDDFDLESLR